MAATLADSILISEGMPRALCGLKIPQRLHISVLDLGVDAIDQCCWYRRMMMHQRYPMLFKSLDQCVYLGQFARCFFFWFDF